MNKTELEAQAAPGAQSQRLVLLNISGQDRVGLLSELCQALAKVSTQVLDIGQAIVHNQLVLSLLVRLPADEEPRRSVVAEVEALARERGVSLRLTPVLEDAYQQWVEQQGQPRYILTLLTKALSAEQLAAVSSVTSRHGLNILNIERLSNRVPLAAVAAPDARGRRASVAMTLRGNIDNQTLLKTDLLAAGGNLDFDCSVQLDSVYRRNRRLVAFDMDSTLIQVEVIDELARMHGVYDQVAQITQRAMAGELDFQESFRERALLLKGMSRSALDEVADAVALTEGAETLINALKHFGYTIALLSGGFQFVGDRLKNRLGIDHVHANSLVFVDGVATGEVQGDIVAVSYTHLTLPTKA